MDAKYKFRREDNGEVVDVDFGAMMDQDCAGYITLPDGVLARRCLHLETGSYCGRIGERVQEHVTGTHTIVSDALGFIEQQLPEMEDARIAGGHTDIEFRRDPRVPGFIQVTSQSRDAFNRYMRSRGFVNNSSLGGVRLTEDDLAKAKELVERPHV